MSNYISLTSLLLFGFISSFSHAETSVWKVEKAGHHIFIGGTVHLLLEEDHPLPLEYAEAYKASEILVFETDIANSASPEFQLKFVRAISLQDGSTLQSALSKATYDKLASHLESRGSDIGAFAAFTPTGAGLLTVLMEYQRMGLMPQWGVDQVMQEQAFADKKHIAQLETLDEQIEFIANMGKGQEDQMIDYTLRDIARLPEYFAALKNAWRTGSLKSIEEFGLVDIKRDFPSVYQELIVKRNNNWMPQLEAMFKTSEVEFVLVGAAHLAGEDGVINSFKEKGYVISQL